MDTEKYMEEAIRLAKTGMKKGDGGPFGALIVRDGTIIGRGWNRVLVSLDPTAHAEITAIRNACANIGSYWLEGAAIYVNCEPCPMCLAAIYWARITSLTYGASRDDAAAIGFDDALIYKEIAMPPEQRTLRISQQCQSKSVQGMELWKEYEKRKNY